MRPPIIAGIVVMIGLLAIAAPPAPAQTTSQDVSQKASETGQAIKDYTVEKKDEAVAHAKKITADLEAKIKELEAQATKQTGEIKARSQAEIKDLKAKADEGLPEGHRAEPSDEGVLGQGQGRLRRRLPGPGIGLRQGGRRVQEVGATPP
jgi:hypothetical protein